MKNKKKQNFMELESNEEGIQILLIMFGVVLAIFDILLMASKSVNILQAIILSGLVLLIWATSGLISLRLAPQIKELKRRYYEELERMSNNRRASPQLVTPESNEEFLEPVHYKQQKL